MAALFVCLSQAEHRGEEVYPKEFEDALEPLRRLSWGHIGPGAREALTQTGNLKAEQNSRVAESLLARYGREDGLDLAARALDGDLNIAPRSIGEDTTRGIVGRPRRQKLVIEFIESQKLEELPESFCVDPWHDSAPGDARRVLDRFSALSPDVTKTVEAFLKTNGNVTKTADLLGISRQAFYKRLRKYRRLLELEQSSS